MVGARFACTRACSTAQARSYIHVVALQRMCGQYARLHDAHASVIGQHQRHRYHDVVCRQTCKASSITCVTTVHARKVPIASHTLMDGCCGSQQPVPCMIGMSHTKVGCACGCCDCTQKQEPKSMLAYCVQHKVATQPHKSFTDSGHAKYANHLLCYRHVFATGLATATAIANDRAM